MRAALKLVRWILGLVALYYCIKYMRLALRIDGIAAAGPLIFGFGAGIASVLLLFSGLILRFCELCSRPLAGIIMPATQAHKPPLSYILARRHARLLRYADAVEEYQKIIRHYPDEQDAYLELAAQAAQMNDNNLFRKTALAYERHFKRPFPAGTVGSVDGPRITIDTD